MGSCSVDIRLLHGDVVASGSPLRCLELLDELDVSASVPAVEVTVHGGGPVARGRFSSPARALSWLTNAAG